MVRVITVNYKQIEYTTACIDSILKSHGVDLKILLIDNGSTKDENLKLRSLIHEEVEIYWSEKNIGYVGAVNYGLSKSLNEEAEYTIIMNNDTIIASDAISNLVKCAKKHNNNSIVTGKVYHYDRPNVFQHIGSVFVNKKMLNLKRLANNVNDIGQFENECERDMIDDIFWLLPLKVINDVGFYSHYFWFNYEQADYALRAVKFGYRLIYTPLAKLWHKGSISIGGLSDNPIREYWDTKSLLIFKFLHLEKRFFFLYIINYLFFLCKGWLKILIKMILFQNMKIKLIVHSARFIAFFHFFRWLFLKENDMGSVPKSLHKFKV